MRSREEIIDKEFLSPELEVLLDIRDLLTPIKNINENTGTHDEIESEVNGQ